MTLIYIQLLCQRIESGYGIRLSTEMFQV